MRSTRSIRIRMTDSQYERILNRSRAKGFNTISSYIRNLALEKDFFIEDKLMEMYFYFKKRK